MSARASGTLVFISPRFLFPVDSGGKIRTTQILRGLKGGRFRIRLLSPGTEELARKHAAELAQVCDEFEYWPLAAPGMAYHLRRAGYLASELPMPVRSDLSDAALALVQRALATRPTVAVFDFAHTAVLAPRRLDTPSVLFTHNVEAEIFARHRKVASNPLMRAIWANQHRKMLQYERDSLHRFDVVVAVSERDRDMFSSMYELNDAFVIPTGVDLEFFDFNAPVRDRDIVFCGSMDWLANQDGVQYFMQDIWSRIVARVPDARMTLVGRAPPAGLVEAARSRGLPWTFTGFVDDVRPHIRGAAVSVVPLRVGGGTRLKVFESMAMGSVVVSTHIGVEGLPVVSGEHCMIADEPDAFADAVVGLLLDSQRRIAMAQAARRYVDDHFGFAVAARAFERACEQAVETHARERDVSHAANAELA